MKFKTNVFSNNVKYFDSMEDEEDFKNLEPQLGYFRRTQSAQCLDIYIDGPFREPSYYRQVCQQIQDSSEGDFIRFHINSGGGRLDALQSILSSIWKTDATTEAHLEGACHSAASVLAMNCDSVYVSPVSEMLVHHVQFGTAGKASDIRGYVDHVGKITEKLFKESYEYFLTPEEIDKCINGFEMWLDAESIMERLRFKFDKMKELAELELEQEAQQEQLEQLEAEVGAAPKQRKARSRKTTE